MYTTLCLLCIDLAAKWIFSKVSEALKMRNNLMTKSPTAGFFLAHSC